MRLQRRRFLHLALGTATLPALSRIAGAQTYPARAIHLIVGYAAGGPNDTTARLTGQWLSERLGQPFVIENRTGAGGNIGTEVVVRAPPDGYTLLLASSSNAVNTTLYDKLSFDFMRDTVPVAGLVRVPNIMVVNPSVPAKTVPEFIAYAKANPGKINMATAGSGTRRMFPASCSSNWPASLVAVAYRGGGPALVDLLGGQMQVVFEARSRSSRTSRPASSRWRYDSRSARVAAGRPDRGRIRAGLRASQWYGLSAQIRRPRSSPRSTKSSTRFSRMPGSRRGSPIWAASRPR